MRLRTFRVLVVVASACSWLVACGDDDSATSPVTTPDAAASLDGTIAEASADAAHLDVSVLDAADAADAADAVADGGADSERPCVVDGGAVLADAVDLAVGSDFACAVRQGGTVVCWGDNTYGQLGVEPAVTAFSLLPKTVSIPAAAAITHITAGNYQACALDIDGHVFCWGLNGFGQLGNGSVDDGGFSAKANPVPTRVEDGQGVPLQAVAISGAARTTCAVTTTSGLACWGDNFWGITMLTDAGARDVPRPVVLSDESLGSSPIISQGPSSFHACASGAAKALCWGEPSSGSIGLHDVGAFSGVNDPIGPELAEAGVTMPPLMWAVGYDHTCMLDAAHALWCFGERGLGQTGPVAALGETPTEVPLPANVSAVCAGYAHTCVLLATGPVLCFGGNTSGALGGSPASVGAPVAVHASDGGDLGSVVQIAAGGFMSCARLGSTCGSTGGGAVLCWGANTLPDGGSAPSPVPIPAP